jgi:hypothetical protein
MVLAWHDAVALLIEHMPSIGEADQLGRASLAGRPVVIAVVPDTAAVYYVAAQAAQ